MVSGVTGRKDLMLKGFRLLRRIEALGVRASADVSQRCGYQLDEDKILT
jgi:hypothetical protein